MLAGAANTASSALDGCAVTTSASRHYSLSRIAQFVRGERGRTFKLTSATRVSSLMLEAVICIIRFRKLEAELAAIWPGSTAQSQRSKLLCAALSLLCYLFTSADRLYVPGSHWDAARLMLRWTGGIEAAFRAATADRTCPDRRTQ